MEHAWNEHLIAALVLVSRLGDVGTTYLVSPSLKLEANPLARRLKWPFALASLGLALLPYWSVAMALIVLVPSLLVSASNAAGAWLVRAVGEEDYARLSAQAAASARLLPALFMLMLPPFFITLLGLTILLFYPDPDLDYGYYLALGVFGYALALIVYRPLAFFRMRRIGRGDGGGHPRG